MIRRLGTFGSPAVSLAAAAVFFGVARAIGDAPPLAVWGGAVWVFVLTTIVTLPLLARRGGDGAE